MIRRSALVAGAALALAALGACGDSADRDGGAESDGGALVTYGREGGIRFQSSTLTVSTEGKAKVRSEGCTSLFRLDGALWGRLRRVLERTDLSALAGDYPPPAGAADVIAETIVVGGDAVRIGDFSSLPAGTQRELAPLLSVLGETLAKGAQAARATR